MPATQKYYVIEAHALPEVFAKVIEAKQLLASGKCRTVGEAVGRVGLSRSAFYKYKDAIRPLYEVTSGRIVTFRILLLDEPGVLSGILSHFAKSGANILTINQSIPISGQAAVTISARTENLRMKVDTMIAKASRLPGILKIDTLASE